MCDCLASAVRYAMKVLSSGGSHPGLAAWAWRAARTCSSARRQSWSSSFWSGGLRALASRASSWDSHSSWDCAMSCGAQKNQLVRVILSPTCAKEPVRDGNVWL